jgi:hypothetical protein
MIVGVADVTVAIRAEEPAVSQWLSHYMAGFWCIDDSSGRRQADAEVTATVDPSARRRLAAIADAPGAARAEHVAVYLGVTGRRMVTDSQIIVTANTEPVVFVRDGSRVTVVADDSEVLGLAVVRVVRAIAGTLLEKRGFALVHAAGAAATETGAGLLALGLKGAGKTTAVTSLATAGGWAIAAHDRCYIGTVDGRPRAFPWPSSLNIGLGLVCALGWAGRLQTRYRRGERPPYHQHQSVTAAVLAGERTPVREQGRELKIQLLPSHVTGWFGVALAREFSPKALVFTEVDLTAAKTRVWPLDSAPVSLRDVFPPAAGTDHYPDFLALHVATVTQRAQHALAILRGLTSVIPAYRVRLSRDIADNAGVLAGLLT